MLIGGTRKFTFDQAAAWKVNFGKRYQGLMLDEVAMTDEGLRYLDWCLGQDWLRGEAREAIQTYLADPTIAKELEALQEEEA